MGRAALGLLLVVGGVSPAAAQQAQQVQQAQQQADFPLGDEKPTEVLNEERVPEGRGRVNFDTGARLVGQYISRGIAAAKKPSLQPYLTLTMPLPELSGGPLRDVQWYVGSWNSLQSGRPARGVRNRGELAGWVESDLYTGISIGLPSDLRLSFAFYHYISPAHSVSSYSALEWILSYDDKGRWDDIVPLRDFTLTPTLRVTQDLGRPRRKDALYVQPSLTASFNIGSADQPVWIRVPLVVGLSNHHYLARDGGEETFGFFRTGLTIAGPAFKLGANPFRIGVGVDIWLLNDKVANGLDDTEWVGWMGFRWAF